MIPRVEKIGDATVYLGDCLEVLKGFEDESIQTCITSPPYYGLRDYGVKGQIGLEDSIDEYVDRLVFVFREVRRVLRDDGTLWLNLGDSYAGSWGNYGGKNRGGGEQRIIRNGSQINQKAYEEMDHWRPPTSRKIAEGIKPKDLIGVPWRVAFALQSDGWFLRQDIIWSKPNPMPESVRDRCTKSHEYIFLLAKSSRYHFDQEAIREQAKYPNGPGNKRGYEVPGQRTGENANIGGSLHKVGARSTRNKRSVWTVNPARFEAAHFAVFPPELIRPCVMAGSPPGGVVLDPFNGSGTTGQVALEEGRRYVGIELNPEYLNLAIERITPASKQGRLIA